MSDWLDIVGSIVIAGIVILILTNVNISISAAATDNLSAGVMQRGLTSVADLIEHDFYKAGYRNPGSNIVIADSNGIKFFADIDNDGVPDETFSLPHSLTHAWSAPKRLSHCICVDGTWRQTSDRSSVLWTQEY